MSKNTNDWLLDDLEEIEKRSLIPRYLQNPFSITWSKLTNWVQSERVSNQFEVSEICQSEYSERDSIQQQYLYPHFTDRLDHSVYYGVEELGVAEGLTVCMNYLGRNYSETDDTSYPAFPKLVFEDGKIKQLDFWIQPNKRVNWWNLPGWEVKLSMHNAASGVPNCQNR